MVLVCVHIDSEQQDVVCTLVCVYIHSEEQADVPIMLEYICIQYVYVYTFSVVLCVGCDLCFVLGVLRAFSWMCSVVCVGYGACVLLGVMCGLTWMCFVHCVGCAWCCMLGSVCRLCWV